MSEGLPKPDGFDFVSPVEPSRVAEEGSVIPTEIQEDTPHDVSGQVADGSVTLSPEAEARIEELRNRGRIGVLTEGTERRAVDYTGRMKNSEHDPDAIAAVNKANRLNQQKLAERRRRMGATQEGIGEKWDARRDGSARYDHEAVRELQQQQDGFRGDLLDLYARDPEKYKIIPTEEFVAQGREFKKSSWETSRLAYLESSGKWLEEKLPQLVEDASSITDFCSKMDVVLNEIRWQLERQGDKEALYGFIEAVEGKEIPDMDTLPDDNKTDEQIEAIRAYNRGKKARRDTEDRLYMASLHGYFRPDDFVSDLDRSPREQMKEAVERAMNITDQWVEAGQKARTDFEEKWGKAPESTEPEWVK